MENDRWKNVYKSCYELKCRDCIFRNHKRFCNLAREEEEEQVFNILKNVNDEVSNILKEMNIGDDDNDNKRYNCQ